MLVMTAKVDKKKIAIIFAAVIVIVAALILALSGGSDAEPTVSGSIANNDARVAFLKEFGWDVTTSPVQSSQVRIPKEFSEVLERYNALQKSQGYDLSTYAGKTVMRYVYEIKNFPGASEPVYATLLIYKDQVIGGDVTDTSAKGKIQGFKMAETPAPTAPSEETQPSE